MYEKYFQSADGNTAVKVSNRERPPEFPQWLKDRGYVEITASQYKAARRRIHKMANVKRGNTVDEQELQALIR
jgi:hypothetical protein